MKQHKNYTAQLRWMIDQAFNEEELRTLAFDLQVDYDSLPGRGKAAKVRELVSLMQRSDRLPELVSNCEAARPHLDWSDQSASPASAVGLKRRKQIVVFIALAVAVAITAAVVASVWLRPSPDAETQGMVEIQAEAFANRPAETADVASFWIDRYEVTNAEFRDVEPDYSFAAGQEAYPVRNIPWEAANQYCIDVNKRLPTEAEWELAARGPAGWLYPWGNDVQAVTLPATLYAVGSVPINRSFYGVFDMYSNVAEWVSNPFTPVTDGQEVARGGSVDQQRDLSRAVAGDPTSDVMAANIGVRCAADNVAADSPTNLGSYTGLEGIGLDEFTSVDEAWPNDPSSNEIGYHPPDYFHLGTTAKDVLKTAFFEGARGLDNFILEADVFVDEDVAVPDGDYRYGLAFREADDHFYAFLIQLNSQSWAVVKVRDGRVAETLISGTSPNIKGKGNTVADAEDCLAVVANGPDMTFLIDGEIVSHVYDEEWTTGRVGFVAESMSEDLGHFHFDRISLKTMDRVENRVALGSGMQDAAAESVGDEIDVSNPEEAEVTPETETEAVPATPDVTTPTPVPAIPAVSSLGMVAVDISGTVQLDDGRQVQIAPFWLDRYETTNFDYSKYQAATGVAPPAEWIGGNMPDGRGRYPVQGVSWSDAAGYCSWANKRLPAEAEWEIAARGPHLWTYPWGDERDDVSLPTDALYAVGTYPDNRSYYGALDMAGNVWEWVDSPDGAASEAQHVVRGGNFRQVREMTEPLVVSDSDVNVIQSTGFRCAASEVTPLLDVDDIVFTFEDFTAEAERGWEQGSESVEGYFIGYHATDFYHVDLSRPNDCLAVFNDSVFNSFIAESASYIKRTDDEGIYRYGIALTQDGREFYAFMLSPVTREWFVVRNGATSMELLANGSYVSLDGLSEATADRLAVIVNGTALTFFVNGELAARVSKYDFPVSQIGFIVQTLDETNVHSHFDRLSLRALSPDVPAPAAGTPTPPIQADFASVCQGSYSNESKLSVWRIHVVAAGDTLAKVADSYGVTTQSILDINNIEDPNVIRIGETFLIPPLDE